MLYTRSLVRESVFSSDEIDRLVDYDTRTGVAALGLRGRYWFRPAGTDDLGRASCRALLADAKEIVASFVRKDFATTFFITS
jgi:hypothetical protein